MNRKLLTRLFACGIFLSAFILSGCAPKKNVIPKLRYQEDIGITVPKKACIYWVPGRRVGSEKASPTYSASYSSGSSGAAGAVGSVAVTLLANMMQAQHKKNNPSQYTYEYGKADEVVFITSLKDILLEQNTFKDVELITNPKQAIL